MFLVTQCSVPLPVIVDSESVVTLDQQACAYDWSSFKLRAKLTYQQIYHSLLRKMVHLKWQMSLAFKYSELIGGVTCRSIVISSVSEGINAT